MWTPKRIFLLALGFALLFASYLVYAHYLGGIDGLPPLPEVYLPRLDHGVEPLPLRPSQVDERLEMAFGNGCKELLRPVRLEVHSHGIVLSTDSYVIHHDGPHVGQVSFQPLSLAIFSKKTPPGQFPEINTIRCKTAYIRFDRPIGTLLDMSKAKIAGAELQDEIVIVNNRRKPHSNEELVVWMPKGPLYYQAQSPPVPGAERKPEVYTDEWLKLTDNQTKPEPTQISAKGMEMFLTVDNPAQREQTSPHKPRGESISGVERIYLRSDVEMILYSDPREGFMATGAKPPAQVNAATAKPARTESPEKSQINIKTAGPFTYDVQKDFAVFEVPAKANQHVPQPVMVRRIPQPKTNPHVSDQLDCERLELQFRRKKPADTKTAAADNRSAELEIDTAHATGKEVVLTSDAEMLHILEANDFFYEAAVRRTTIKGNQKIIVVKDGHDLTARELYIEEQPGGQRLTALGPGTIALLDKETRKRSVNAKWNDKLFSNKDGDFDLLILTGQASFEDKEHEQYLQGEEIKVWLEPSAPAKTPTPSPQGAGQGGRRPHRIEATGGVLARSREMNVHDSEKMVITFKDAAVAPRLPAAGNITAPERGAPASQPATGPITVPKPAPAAQPDKPARPIDLSAHLVEAHVLRLDSSKNELEKLRTEGQVHVQQAPEKPGERGLDIRGDTLELTKKPDGNEIVVTSSDLAELEMDKLAIRGPQINIDQAENKAWVNGRGAMTLESDRNFQGTQLKQPVPITIIWDKSMFFNGSLAEFQGGIQAEQENAHLGCQSLQVILDRPISLREGEKNGPPAKVDRLVCDKDVMVDDSEYEGGRLIKYQRLDCRELDVDNVHNTAHAYGPKGKFRIWQLGDAGSPLAPTASQPASKKPTQEMKLTRITFDGRMWADNKSHTAIFNDNVTALNFATENKDADPDLDHLPDDAVYLRCTDQMKVYNRPENGKSNQQLEAEGRVICRTKEYEAHAEKVTYNEAKDQLIFDGGDGGFAHLIHFLQPGIPPQESKAKRFIYLRKTGQIFSDGVQGVRGTTR